LAVLFALVGTGYTVTGRLVSRVSFICCILPATSHVRRLPLRPLAGG